MKVAIVEKAPKFKGIETGHIEKYNLEEEKDFDDFCLTLISIGNTHRQKWFKVVTENKHELNFTKE